jgi:putative endonuclease
MSARSFYVYILTNRIGGTLYIGVTNDLIRRVAEHRLKIAESFTKRHDLTRLVYFRVFRPDRTGDPPREAVKEVASRLEDFTYRERQSELD